MKIHPLLAGLAAILVAGCVSEADQRSAEMNFIAGQRQRCLAYGYKDQTNEMAACMERGAYERRQQQAATAQAIASINQPRPQLPGYQVVPTRKATNCTSQMVGGYLQTVCQ